ncbi:MAG: TIGR03790 family protein [Pseudomonadota bacterium]
MRLTVLLVLALGLMGGCDAAIDQPAPAPATLGPEHLAVIVNDRDPLSREIVDYYVARRRIPAANVIHVQFPPGGSVMRVQDFLPLRAEVLRQTPATVQAYALAWTTPYRVGCMSITTAMAAGFRKEFCAIGCKPTAASPYFDSDSHRPFDDFGWRPSILLAGTTLAAVKSLIDRGVAADGTHPAGDGFLMVTSDRARNARARFYQGILLLQSDRFRLHLLQQNSLKDRKDVLFYFTGLATVPDIDTNTFLPGAIADHLTSAGGQLTDSRQMSSLRWLEAGATGSYGSVTEPCNYVQKFPRPNIVINRYLNGETLLEAYWKSVQWPGQGVFIGEPLASPFH